MPKRQLTYMWGGVAAISLLAPSVAQIPQPVADSARSSRPRPTARSWVAMEDLLAVYTIKPGRAARCVRLSPIGRQPLHARAARSLAARQSHRSPHRRGLCSRLERRGRYPLFRSPDHRSGRRTISRRTVRSLSGHEARRLVERFEWHYTPKHGCWLNLAESELGVLSSQCPDRRIPDKQTLRRGRRRLAAGPQCQSRQGQLALHNTIRSRRTQAPVPVNLTESGGQCTSPKVATPFGGEAKPEVSPLRHTCGNSRGRRAAAYIFASQEVGEVAQRGLTFRSNSPEPLHAAPVRRPDHADA